MTNYYWDWVSRKKETPECMTPPTPEEMREWRAIAARRRRTLRTQAGGISAWREAVRELRDRNSKPSS